MKTPRYTDNRYLHGYVPATRTDIEVTCRRVRREMAEADANAKEIKEETQLKVRSIAK